VKLVLLRKLSAASLIAFEQFLRTATGGIGPVVFEKLGLLWQEQR